MRSDTVSNYLFLAAAVLLPEIQMLFLPLGGSGIVQLGLSIIAILFSLSEKKFLQNISTKPLMIWLLWVIYTSVNWVICGHKSNIPDWAFIFNRIALSYFTLVFAYYELMKNHKRTSLFLCCILLIYVVIGLAGQGSISYDEDRGGMLLGNLLPLVACTAFFLSSYCNKMGYIKMWVPVLALLLAIIATLFVAERKALGAIIIVLFFSVVQPQTLKKPSRLIPLLIIVIIAYFGVYWILDNTLLGERMLETRDQGERFTDNEFLFYLGDRAIFYEGGWQLFLENPISGVGLRNFTLFGYSEIVLHSEYMVQLCEGGIIGSALYLMFCFSLFKRMKKTKQSQFNNISAWMTCLGEIVSIFFLSFITWTFDQIHYFIAIAVIFSYCEKIKIHESYSHKLESAYRG